MYRRVITVLKTLNGYNLSGSRIWFQFKATANEPMPQIIYFNGRRVALGDDLEPIVLFEQARPGDQVLVAVKHSMVSEPSRGGLRRFGNYRTAQSGPALDLPIEGQTA